MPEAAKSPFLERLPALLLLLCLSPVPSLTSAHTVLVLAMCKLAVPSLAAGPHIVLVLAVPSLAAGPHIVLVLADDLGWGDVGWNNPRMADVTPHLTQLARWVSL